MAPATIEKMSPADLLRELGKNGTRMFEDAYKKGRSLSAELEVRDPSSQYPNSPLDAFGRLLQVAGIKTRSLPELGIYADNFARFTDTEQGRALACEFIARTWRGVATGLSPSTRSLYMSSDVEPGTVMRPFVDAARARFKQIQPAIPLSEIVGITTGIDRSTYRSFYLVDNTDEARMKRVAEGTAVPMSKLEGTEHTIVLRKYGRGLEMTYEQLREMQIDLVALHIARMAIQAESDKVDTALNVLIDGDGNPDTAANVLNLTDLDPDATTGQLSLDAWLEFKLSFLNPYMFTTMLSQSKPVKQVMKLNIGSANVPVVAVQGQLMWGGLRPINRELEAEPRYGILPSAPAMKIIGFDKQWSLEYVTQIGASVTEVAKYIRDQHHELVMTDTEGFSKFDSNGVFILDLNN